MKPLSSAQPSQKQALIFDTGIHSEHMYDHPINILKSLGWQVRHKTILQACDHGLDHLFSPQPQMVIFVIDVELIRAQPHSPVAQTVYKALNRAAKIPHTLTAIMLPSVGNRELEALAYISPIMNALGLNLYKQEFRSGSDGDLSGLSKKIARFIANPFEVRGYRYHTTLNLARPHGPLILKDLGKTLVEQNGRFFGALPVAPPLYDQRLEPLLPLGLYIFNPLKHHHLVFSFNALMSTFGAAENFQFYPMEFSLQHQLNTLVHAMWTEIDYLFKNKPVALTDSIEQTLTQLHQAPLVQKTHHSSAKKFSARPLKTAWMELVAYEETGKETPLELKKKRGQQQALAEKLLKSKLDYLWIGLSPQMYYAPQAKNPAGKAQFENGVKRFITKLTQTAKELKLPVPAILVGFEIANNLYAPHLPNPVASDIYGKSYPDMPSPLDQQFWHDQLVNPLKMFANFFNKECAPLGATINGIVIDLELYGRTMSSVFYSTMACDEQTLKEFIATQNAIVDEDKLLEWVITHKKLHALISFAKSLAFRRGKEIYSAVQNIFKSTPNSRQPFIGCYSPHISLDWFYANFYAALGTSQQPLHLFTFNTVFEKTEQLLRTSFNIHARHSSVLMLSKLNTPSSFKLIDTICQHNHGIWLNRASRLVEAQDPEAWFYVEQPRFTNKQDLNSFCNYLANFSQVAKP